MFIIKDNLDKIKSYVNMLLLESRRVHLSVVREGFRASLTKITRRGGRQTKTKATNTKQNPTNPQTNKSLQLFRRMKTEEEMHNTYRDWT